MPKLFVSLPMRGRTEEEVREEMAELNDICNNEYQTEFELIESFEYGNPPSDIPNESVWYLGKSIVGLSEADLVIFSADWRNAHGCIIEHMICALYNIPYVELQPGELVDLDNAEVVVDYTHDLDEQPVEIVDKIDILHKDDDDSLSGEEHLEEPDLDDYDPDLDELEPGEFNADL
jgi:hypothetical protein